MTQHDMVRQILDRTAAERESLIRRQKESLVMTAVMAFLVGMVFAALVNNALVSWWVG